MTIEEAKASVALMASEAAQKDTWMQPAWTRVKFKDYGQDSQVEQEGWEETDHFGIVYRTRIVKMAQAVSDNLWMGIYEDLISVFWEVWFNEKSIFQSWEAAKNKFTKNK